MIDGLFQVGIDILVTTLESKTKSILAQLGDVINKVVDCDNAEWYQHVGFSSRPSKSDGKTAAQAVAIRRSDRDIVIASKDPRSQAIYGSLKAGETAVYATGEDGTAQGRILLKSDSSINIFTRTSNSPSGTGMGIFVTPSQNKISIINGKGYGLVIDEDGVKILSGDSAINLSSSGTIDVLGKGAVTVDGTAVVLGAGPVVPAVSNAIHGATGLTGIASTKVFIPT